LIYLIILKAYDGTMSALFDKQNGICDEEREKNITASIDFIQKYFKEVLNSREKLINNGEMIGIGDFCEILVTSNDPDTGKHFTEEQVI
jgi:hypothetical protein